jgi:hypothetical protein
MLNLILKVAFGFATAITLVWSSVGASESKVQTIEFLSQGYKVDKIYKSMEGPSSKSVVFISADTTPELVWITGYRTTVVAEDGETPVSQQFLCHNNLDLRPHDRNSIISRRSSASSRLFTLSQGVFSIEFPEGFGIPVMSNQALDLTTQVLNHNIKDVNIVVKHKVEVDYVSDRDANLEMTALMPVNAFVMATLDGTTAHYGVKEPDKIQQAASCLPGTHAGNNQRANIFKDLQGQEFSGHWVVPMGKETRRTLVTKVMNIPFNTKIHNVAVHVHPFSKSLELRDLTTGKEIFKSTMQAPEDGIGLSHVEGFNSADGIPVYMDHDYELISIYDNHSGELQDAMATMQLYIEDKEFVKPKLTD